MPDGTAGDLPAGGIATAAADRIAEAIRDHILSGALAAEAPIRQDALAGELGVSKIPVREALIRLQQDGLIDAIANRGFFVRGLSGAEAYEVYDLRMAIEPAAAAAAALVANETERHAASHALAVLSQATARQARALGALHRAFHNSLVKPAGRHLTSQLVERLHIVSERYVRRHLAPSGRTRRANAEHAGILAAWLDRDASLVTRMMGAHIRNVRDDLKHELEPAEACARQPMAKTTLQQGT